MIKLHEEYVVDNQGHRKSIVIPVGEWREILEALEELDDIHAYDEAKQARSEPIPFAW